MGKCLCGPFVHLALEGLCADAGGDRLCNDGLFALRVAGTEEHGRVADACLSRCVLRNKLLEHPHLPHLRMRALAHEIADLRRPILAIAINPPVTLLEPQEGPGKIEMDEPVTLEMQVEPF